MDYWSFHSELTLFVKRFVYRRQLSRIEKSEYSGLACDAILNAIDNKKDVDFSGLRKLAITEIYSTYSKKNVFGMAIDSMYINSLYNNMPTVIPCKLCQEFLPLFKFQESSSTCRSCLRERAKGGLLVKDNTPKGYWKLHKKPKTWHINKKRRIKFLKSTRLGYRIYVFERRKFNSNLIKA